MNIKQQLELVKAERDKWKAVAKYRQKLIEKLEGENVPEIRNPRQAARPESNYSQLPHSLGGSKQAED